MNLIKYREIAKRGKDKMRKGEMPKEWQKRRKNGKCRKFGKRGIWMHMLRFRRRNMIKRLKRIVWQKN